ncbi:MAG: outer membrane beta-barrel protein [Bacteroidota bacterium]
MKKIIIPLLLLCLLTSYTMLSAQEIITVKDSTAAKPEKKTKFWMGPKFGLDLSPVKFDEIGSQLSSNYQIGIMLQFGRTLYFQPEIYYASYKNSLSASSYGYGSIDANPDLKKSVNFIKMPLLVGLKFLDLGLFSLHIKTGPSLTFKLDNNDGVSGDNTFSWQVGTGVDILGFITTDIRYTMIKGVSIGDQINNFSRNTSMLNLTVGLRL